LYDYTPGDRDTKSLIFLLIRRWQATPGYPRRGKKVVTASQ